MAAINPIPECPRCGDFYYIRNTLGQLVVCPKCSCSRCHRLKNAAPKDGGCMCPQNRKPALAARQSGGSQKGAK